MYNLLYILARRQLCSWTNDNGLLSVNSILVKSMRASVARSKVNVVFSQKQHYNPFLVYCRMLAPGSVSLTGDRAQGDDSKHDSYYSSWQSMAISIRSKGCTTALCVNLLFKYIT